MKRLISMMAVLLALTMVLALAGCGKQETTPTQSTGTAQTSAPSKTADLSALRDHIISDCGITDSINVETSGLTNVYGIAADDVASSASFTAAAGAAFPQEIVMVQAKDEAAAANVKSKLESHLKEISDQAASYDPESQALAEKCTVVTNGIYVGMFFSKDYDKMVSAFNSAVQ